MHNLDWQRQSSVMYHVQQKRPMEEGTRAKEWSSVRREPTCLSCRLAGPVFVHCEIQGSWSLVTSCLVWEKMRFRRVNAVSAR